MRRFTHFVFNNIAVSYFLGYSMAYSRKNTQIFGRGMQCIFFTEMTFCQIRFHI
jgi:hypothetical protein